MTEEQARTLHLVLAAFGFDLSRFSDSPPTMLPLQSPLDAYRSDLSRNPGRKEFARSDTIWLLVAHCLHRMTKAPATSRSMISEYCADALRDLSDTVEPTCDEERVMAEEFRRLRRGLPRMADCVGADEVSQSVRVLADQMGEAGALSLAFSTLGHLRAATPSASPREQGFMLADQARVARLLGDLDGADELYDLSDRIAARHDVAEIAARAALGKGVIARVRGNYPRARKFFEEGLARAESAGLRELTGQAHQGLVIAAATAGDLDTALVHGWRAYELLSSDQTRQAEMLVNLAQLCMMAGYPAAALRGLFAATSRQRSTRFCLPTYGSAADAGAALGSTELVERLASRIEDLVLESGLPYESAQALRSLYTAFSKLGDAPRAEGYRTRARDLAKRNGFFEIVLATEAPEVGVAPTERPRPRVLAKPSYQVVQSIESLDAPDHEELLATTHAG